MPAPVIPPAGTSAAGFFLATTHAPPGEPVGILADPIDPTTLDFLSIERGFDPTDAAALTAIATERASGSAVQDVGQRYRAAELVDDQTGSFFRQETEFALKHLVESGQIRIERFDGLATPGTDYAEARIFFKNLARNDVRPGVPLPLNETIGR